MAKCGFCNSCLKPFVIELDKYLVCSFCKTVYTVENNKLVLVIDKQTTDKIAEMKGWSIE